MDDTWLGPHAIELPGCVRYHAARVTPNRRVVRRPYFLELFVGANAVVIFLLADRRDLLLGSVWPDLLTLAFAFFGYGAAGVVLRVLVAHFRRDRTYLRIIRRRAWLIDTVRLALFSAAGSLTYAWIKLLVPTERSGLYDQQLWDAEQAILAGLSPNILLLELFAHPLVLRVIDWTYANIFLASLFVAMGFFLSHGSRRIRVAFATGNMLMWVAGAWLYMLVPSVGPAYRFPEVWFAYADHLPRTQALQALLMRNYQNVLRLWRGEPGGPILTFLGIGAFPSLHVAFQMYVFLWMRRLWRPGQLLFAMFLVAIFIGSVVTGWHYLLDSVAGLLLAMAAFAVAARRYRVDRWLRASGN